MLNKEREQEIINILKHSNGFVTVKYLCESLYASESSIRRDLKSLEKLGIVNKSYGGASLVVKNSNIITFNHRTRQNTEAKRDIAHKAATLIKEGDIVFLDQSSTAFYVANEIINRNSMTVVTNNIEIMMLLSSTNIKIISSGGELSRENQNCLIGSDAQTTFNNIFADIVFFSVKAVSEEGVLSDCSREEVILRNAMLKNSEKKVFVCDSSKFGKKSSYKQCEINDIDYLISENNSAQFFSSLKKSVVLL